MRRSFGGCEVHLEAAVDLTQSGLAVEAEHTGASLPVKSREALGGDKDTETQPENRSRRLSMVGLELAAPAVTHLDQLRTATGLYLPERHTIRRITGHERWRRVVQRQIRVGPRPSRLPPRLCSTKRVI